MTHTEETIIQEVEPEKDLGFHFQALPYTLMVVFPADEMIEH